MSGDAAIQKIDRLTLFGLVLLLDPLLTMGHELAGHGGACLVSGGRITEIGAHYINCESATLAAGRFVAVAGAGMDVAIAAAGYLVWRRTTMPLLRTALWIVVVTKLMLAAGYPLFSGIIGVGDFAVGSEHSLGAVPAPWAWRIGFTLIGLASYIAVVVLAIRMLRQMLGLGQTIRPAQRQIALTTYVGSGLVTLLASAINPVWLFIILTSAAASFGGLAGLFNVAYNDPPAGDARPFLIGRNWPVIIAGIVATGLFVAVLGPSIKFS